jgi:hypothetical protein
MNPVIRIKWVFKDINVDNPYTREPVRTGRLVGHIFRFPLKIPGRFFPGKNYGKISVKKFCENFREIPEILADQA